MIESISGATEAPAPSTTSPAPHAPASAAAAISQTLATGPAATSYAGTWEAATRHASETTAISRQETLRARSLDAVEDVVIRNLLDSLSPASRIVGSFILADEEEMAPRSLIATYYEDV
ncbi:hypothetical protein ACFFP0_20850 [Rhizobium puerariae]|uniref:Uncharacterized protein n=1 Tax=Rhizobium puerariae TaxID=1585791 RepID=A0ABV6AL04_9HYPH